MSSIDSKHPPEALALALTAIARGDRIVAILGLPGAGKTWLLEALAAKLGASGRTVATWPTPLDVDVLLCDAMPHDDAAHLSRHHRAQLVMTSRRRPPFDAALVEVSPLSLPHPATRFLADLLSKYAPRPETPDDLAHLQTIATAADGLPGALTLAAEAARLMDLPTLARRAQTEPEHLFKPLVTALAAELATLPTPELTALRRLAQCPHGPLTTTAETLVDDLTTTTTRLDGALGLLGALRDRHLLTRHGDRLMVPHLVRTALGPEHDTDTRRDVALRLARIAERTSQTAERQSRSEPLEWIGHERTNLIAALETLLGTPAAWPLLHALLVEHWRGTSPPVRLHRRRLADLLEHMLDAVPDEPSPPLLRTMLQVARASFDWRNAGLLSRLATLLRDKAPESYVRTWVDVARAMVENARDLRERLAHSLDVARRSDDRLFEGLAHLQHSGALGLLDPDAARRHAEEAHTCFEACGYQWGVAVASGNLCFFAMARGEPDAARRHGAEALSVAERSGDKRSLSNTFGNLGMLELDQGDLATSRRHLTRSYELHEAMNRPDFMAACLNGLARIAVEYTSTRFTPEDARELDRLESALIEIEHPLGDADRRLQQIESALVRAEMALLRADIAAARYILDEALALPELADYPKDALVLNARRAVLAPDTSEHHRAVVADLLARVAPCAHRVAAQVYRATWCTDAEWSDLAPELGRLARVPLAHTPPLGIAPAWNNSALVRAALRTTWPLLSDTRRQDIEAEARDPERLHLLVAISTGRFRMPRQPWSDVSRRPLLVQLLTHLVDAREQHRLLDEPTLGKTLWPGERMLDDARSNRIQNAISLLRKAGLKDHLERIGESYRIDPTLPFITITGARDTLG